MHNEINRFLEELKNISKDKNIILFGAGWNGQKLYQLFLDNFININYFVDDVVQKEYICDTKIIKSEELYEIDFNNYILIITLGSISKSKIIVDNIKNQNKRIKTITLNQKFLDELEKIDIYKVSNFLKEALPFYEPNCFKDALLNGYLENKIDYKYYTPNYYYYNDIKVSKNDIVVDCGTSSNKYGHNTALDFAKNTENTIYCFEPNKKNFNELKLEIKDKNNIIAYNKAVGDSNKKVMLIGDSESCYVDTSLNSNNIDLITLDSFINHEVNFIKMDIEGFELEALKGSERIIKEFRPKLAICLYHKAHDILYIAKYLKELVPEYNIWIVNNEGNFWDGTKLFAKVN